MMRALEIFPAFVCVCANMYADKHILGSLSLQRIFRAVSLAYARVPKKAQNDARFNKTRMFICAQRMPHHSNNRQPNQCIFFNLHTLCANKSAELYGCRYAIKSYLPVSTLANGSRAHFFPVFAAILVSCVFSRRTFEILAYRLC